MAWPGEIGDFVAAVASPSQAITGGGNPIGSAVLIGQLQLTALLQL
tara:strand:- start:322 stop:459 length:138 start_codon:yes stop_codon:yes gene_type:complete